VARVLQDHGCATLLFDLLTEAESADRSLVFDIDLLAGRLRAASAWINTQPDVAGLPVGYFGASTGAAAALVAAANEAGVRAVVSRGGRPDLAGSSLPRVLCPTLLIVGGADFGVIELNEDALRQLGGPKRLEIVPGASHLFEERGALEQVAALAAAWFAEHLPEA
jgi:putative phosphoribosyl transferase